MDKVEKRSELVFASVCPLGTDQEQFARVLEDCVKQYRYEFVEVRLSSSLSDFEELEDTTSFQRASKLMDAGNDMREDWNRGDSMALCAVADISRFRKEKKGPCCFYIRSLKHPKEVATLRKIYGNGFFLIGLHSDVEERFSYLTGQKGMTETEAAFLMKRDQSESSDLGQQTRKTFAQADVFLWVDRRQEVREQLQRFLDLVFGYPYHTPTQEEYGMYMAFAAALRSSDLSRQVGASIFSENGDVIATGCNDVPKAGGGLYWPGVADHREFQLGYDSNEKQKEQIILELVRELASKELIPDGSDEDLLKEGYRLFGETRLVDLTEFGRIVHAEMDALLSAARIGARIRGATLFATTFPCHNCAKHIVAAGISRVLFVEPYPKSKALELHSDSITVGAEGERCQSCDQTKRTKVKFEPFVGIGARRYSDLFSMGWSAGYPVKRKENGEIVEWERVTASPRVPLSRISYFDREKDAMELLERLVSNSDE